MAKISAKARLRQLQSNPRKCDLGQCFNVRSKFSRYCRYHDRVNQRTGHPLGTTIRKYQLAPYAKEIEDFIKSQVDHPGIIAALNWVEGVVERASPLRTPDGSALDRLNRWLFKMREAPIHPEAMLSTIAGMYLMREVNNHVFQSDRHFNHQLAIRFLRLVPAPTTKCWDGECVRKRYARITVEVRDLLARRINAAIGGFCIRIARHLVSQRDQHLIEELSKKHFAEPFVE